MKKYTYNSMINQLKNLFEKYDFFNSEKPLDTAEQIAVCGVLVDLYSSLPQEVKDDIEKRR